MGEPIADTRPEAAIIVGIAEELAEQTGYDIKLTMWYSFSFDQDALGYAAATIRIQGVNHHITITDDRVRVVSPRARRGAHSKQARFKNQMFGSEKIVRYHLGDPDSTQKIIDRLNPLKTPIPQT